MKQFKIGETYYPTQRALSTHCFFVPIKVTKIITVNRSNVNNLPLSYGMREVVDRYIKNTVPLSCLTLRGGNLIHWCIVVISVKVKSHCFAGY
jgi:hypothetical protein